MGRAWPLNRKSRVKGDVSTRRRRPLRNPRGVLSWKFTPKAQNMQNAFSKQGDISACLCDSPSGEAVCSFPESDVRGSPQRIRCLSASAAAVLPWALASTRCPRGEAPEPETHPCGEHHPPALTDCHPVPVDPASVLMGRLSRCPAHPGRSGKQLMKAGAQPSVRPVPAPSLRRTRRRRLRAGHYCSPSSGRRRFALPGNGVTPSLPGGSWGTRPARAGRRFRRVFRGRRWKWTHPRFMCTTH